jgi:hypothetical protein
MIKSTCSDLKLSAQSPHRLADCEEARGQLLRIFEAEGQCIATFAWGCCSFPAELREELEPLVGHDIAVLRLGKYHFQVVD